MEAIMVSDDKAGRDLAGMVKERARELGCDLCGIAPIDRFGDMPDISNPAKILPEAESVIVIAFRFLASAARAGSTVPYTIVRNGLSRKVDEATIGISYFLEELGYLALPTGAIEPCNYDKELGKTMGLISLKNAARQAGLGTVGKNTLLVTPRFGNMVWLGAVITSAAMAPDRLIEVNPCPPSCRICMDSCPVMALDGGPFMDQGRCWSHAFGRVDGGEWRIRCNRCRISCPLAFGSAGQGRAARCPMPDGTGPVRTVTATRSSAGGQGKPP
jgi:epoxyqueuosine reductase QueG